jgi:hypothetical protein
MDGAAIVDNLLSPPVLAFVVSLAAALLRFDLRLPEALYPILSSYLLLAIGLKGGRALADSGLADAWAPLVASVGLGVVTPILAFVLLRGLGRIGRTDAAGIAAHYGSVSAVTFTVIVATLDSRGTAHEGYMAGLLAVLEVVGIVVAISLARDSSTRFGRAVGEVVRGRSISFLLGGIVIGWMAGGDRLAPVDPVFTGLFTGALVLFLVEMGALAAERLRDVRTAGWRLAVLAVAIPLVNGAVGALAGAGIGLSTGGTAILATLAASASYIAAPAAVRIALPKASPGLYVTASLGITFPFNLVVGIPLYIALAEALT